MQNNLGTSLYPGSFQEIPSCIQEGSLVFTSAHIPEAQSDPSKLKDLVDQLHARKAKVMCDVDDQTASQYGFDSLDEFARAMDLDILRLDFGFTLEEIDQIAFRIPVALNASTIETETKKWLLARHPSLLFVHNFYPRPETGLDLETFCTMNEGVPAANLSVFIPGDEVLRGPLFQGLPTLESHRHGAPYVAWTQFKRLGIDQILVGDPGLSERELNFIQQAMQGCYLIPVLLEDFADSSILDKPFTIRADSPKTLRRLAESRLMHDPAKLIAPSNTVRRVRGSLCQDNESYGRYAGEIMITTSDYPADDKVNVIGRVHPRYAELLDFIPNGAKIQLVQADQYDLNKLYK